MQARQVLRPLRCCVDAAMLDPSSSSINSILRPSIVPQLQTSAPGVFAAGDIASWPDPRVGRIRVEHWVVAERQGQTAARNMLGAGEAFSLTPYFWSQHYDFKIDYVGHADRDDGHTVSGDPMAHDCTVAFSNANGELHAEADVGRERESLWAEARMDQ